MSDALSSVLAAVFEGDMRKALQLLDAVPDDALDQKDRSVRANMRIRFARSGHPPDQVVAATLSAHPPIVAGAIAAYQAYWRRMLLAECSAADADSALRRDLNSILDNANWPPWNREDIEGTIEAATSAIQRHGFHALTGITPPFREMMIWRSQSELNYVVALPERSVEVKVIFLDDFLSRGWSAYGSCDATSSAGWATSDALYAVKPAYDVDS